METEVILSENLFPVIGVGASAGGLDAFKRLLGAIPENSGVAYILVQHLDPQHDSFLTELLQKSTSIPVLEIVDNIKVLPNHIYIIPSNKLLKATDGVLQLTPRLKNQLNMPIDLFFLSLAHVHKDHAIGVVLSGKGSDGSLGLKAIKEQGGITLAQSLESATYDSMPRTAMEAGLVDFILTPEEIPAQVARLTDRLMLTAVKDDTSPNNSEKFFKDIFSLLKGHRNVDFTYYKENTIRRRISRRLALSMKESMEDYLVFLRENSSELDLLYQDLLIPVTQFFRDIKVFDALCETVFPALLKAKAPKEPIRIWVAGCSTGEEAYSFMICLNEFLGEKAAVSKIQLFATDISEIAIQKARAGIYSESEVEGLSPARLEEFFTKTDGKYKINKSIRDSCIFSYHNYLKDPPFARMDLISCRNSLIYFQQHLQKKALTTFHYALNDNSFLVLGKSETASQTKELFHPIEKQDRIYQRKTSEPKFLLEITARKSELFKEISHPQTGKPDKGRDDIQKNVDDILSKYTPAGVVVNNELDIVHFRGATGMWLEQSSGKPNWNILKMAREGLSFELRNALHKVAKTREPVITSEIPIQFMGKEYFTIMEVIPLLNTIDPHFFILFRNRVSPDIKPGLVHVNGEKTEERAESDQRRIEQLQKELAQVRDDMRIITEDQEASNEELQSANEELLSGSEELQSLNEELETSREETQTSNEELLIVNQELVDRNDQLNISRIYAESIVTTISEPLIILNKNLQVRTANRSFYTRFETSMEETEGKLFFDLSERQWDIPALREKLNRIIPENRTITDFEVMHTFPKLGERIMLLNARTIIRDNNEDESILLAIEDITAKRKIEEDLKMFAEKLEQNVYARTLSLNQVNSDLLHSNKTLEQFAYVASHDLQEPLRKITVFLTLLQDRFSGGLPAEGIELVEKSINSSKRMSELIRGLLNFSSVIQANAGFEKTDLNETVSITLVDLEMLVDEKKAIIHCEPLPVIDAIPSQLNQLFCNLVSNSLKFSRGGHPPVITISSRIVSSREIVENPELNAKYSYCAISINDNGIGFSNEYADQIFLIFQRLHGKDQYAGTGIGLALCKSIVVNHHGSIKAFSEPGKGSTFEVILPMIQDRKDSL